MAQPGKHDIPLHRGVFALLVSSVCAGLALIVGSVYGVIDAQTAASAGACCVLGSVAAMVPFRGKAIDELMGTAVISMVVRVVCTFSFAGLLHLIVGVDPQTFGPWLAFWYLLLLFVEVTWLSRLLSSPARTPLGGKSTC